LPVFEALSYLMSQESQGLPAGRILKLWKKLFSSDKVSRGDIENRIRRKENLNFA